MKIYVSENFSVDTGIQMGVPLPTPMDPKFDVGLCLGLTYNFSHFFLQGRGNFGLLPVYYDYHNIVGQFGVGYRF